MNENTDIIRQTGRNDDEVEIDLVELLYHFYSHAAWIIAAFLIGGAVMGLVTFFLITPKYTATSKVYMVSANSDSILDLSDLNLGTSLSKDYAEVLASRPIFEDVIESLGLDYEYEELQDMVNITSVTDTRILAVEAESPDPVEAREIANALAVRAVSELPDLMGTMEPSLIESAITPEKPSSPSYALNIMIGALVGAVLVMALLAYQYISDDTLKDTEDVEAAFGIMPLAVVPEAEIEGLTEKKERKRPKGKGKKESAGTGKPEGK